MPQERDILFGKVVAANKFASGDQIRECLKIQEDTGKNLSEVMVEKGYLTRAQSYQVMARVLAQELKGQTVSGCVAGDFIGLTSTGALLKGKREDSAKDIMLKVLSPALTSDDNFRNAYFEAVKIYGKLKHPNIWGILGMTKREDAIVLVQPAFSGVSLAEIMKTRGHLPPAEAVSVVTQVAQALSAAHQAGVAHGAVRPENIFVAPDRNIMLGNFGQSVPPAAENKITAWSEHFGLPHFLAPEQIRGERGGMPADIFALGVLYYWLLSGQYPFTGNSAADIARRSLQGLFPSLKEVGVSAPDKTVMLIEQMLAHQGVARPSIAEVLPELRDLPPVVQQAPQTENNLDLQEDDQPTYAPVKTRKSVTAGADADQEINAVLAARGISLGPPPKRSNPASLLIGAIVVVVVIVGVIIFIAKRDKPQPDNQISDTKTAVDKEPKSKSEVAQAALESARKFQSTHPDKTIEAIKLFAQVAKDFPNTTQGRDAFTIAKNIRLRHTTTIKDTKLAPFLQIASQAIVENDFNKASVNLNSARTLLSSYPEYCYDSYLVEDLDNRLNNIRSSNKNYLSRQYAQLRASAEDKKDDALQMCDALRKQSLPEFHGMIDQIRTRLTNNVQLPLTLEELSSAPGSTSPAGLSTATAPYEKSPAYMAFWNKYQAFLKQRRFQAAAESATKFTSAPVGEDFKTFARRDAELAVLLYKTLQAATAKLETKRGNPVKLASGKSHDVLSVDVREVSVFDDPEKNEGPKIKIPTAVVTWQDAEKKEERQTVDIAQLSPADLLQLGGDDLLPDDKNISRAGFEFCQGNLEEAKKYFSKSSAHVISVFYLTKLARMAPEAAPSVEPMPGSSSLFPSDEVTAATEKEAADLVERWRAAVNAKNDAGALNLAQKLLAGYIRTQAVQKAGDDLDAQMSVQKAASCPKDMVYVAGGRYRLESSSEQSESVPAFCIDAYEFPNRVEAEPSFGMSYVDAVAACKQSDRKLCNEYQWERACAGAARHVYPYGASYTANTCAFDKKATRPLTSGAKPQCITSSKIFDMVGNLSEWTSGLVANEGKQRQRTIRGGSYNFEKPEEATCFSYEAEFEAVVNPPVGFRCCKEARQ